MPIKNPFIQRVLKSFDRIDRESLQNYLLDLAEENRLYRETLHQLNEGIILIERNGKIRYVNYQASVWLGFESVASGKPQTIQQISDSELKRFLREQIGKVKERVAGDVHVLSPDELDLGVILAPVVGTREDYVLVMMTNLSGEKAPLIDQERMARIEALISLAAGIAHEIGNPLNSLSIHLQICQKEIKGLTKSQKKVIEDSLNVMSAETERLDRIVRNFLKATRRHPLRYRLENINRILEESLNILMPELKDKRIKVDFKPDEAVPLFLQDRDRLNLTFINLIKNGMEAMP
ncbi:MAG: histidine kinase dimerization/phospho-acceptor domain-containing protein, partial [Candidatus Omnitrophica bacterium]|nr:histidine kinase dimerization/phospho-acceptor domain-containing protein [Candidatus Omnitrophota bacterium]